ncbi:MAG: HDIG domain-containing protein, partial [Dehalococcoidia bacterium]|nr:HDIG domain-containing protein [Dehalococcoidia bacterium]
VLVYDTSVAERQESAAADVLHRIQAIKGDASLSLEQKVGSLKQIKDPTLSQQVINYIVEIHDDQLLESSKVALQLVVAAMSEKIRPQDLAQVRQSVLSKVPSEFRAPQVIVATEIGRVFILPNLSVDIEETEKNRKQATGSIEPVRLSIAPGETILRDGGIITPVDMEKLEASKLIDRQMQWSAEVLGNIGLSSLFCVGLGIYLIKGHVNTPVTPKRVLLMVVIISTMVFSAKLLLPGRDLLVYLFPFATAPMLIATLWNPFLAVVVSLPLSIMVTYSSTLSPELLTFLSPSPLDPLAKITLYFASSLTGVLMIWQAKKMHQYLAAGVGVGVAGAAIVLVFWLLTPDRYLDRLGWAILGVMSGGFLSAALTVGFVVLLGHIFGITTSFHLMELAHPDHPLLRKLLLESPGTYYHSLIVGNLAEQAADVIGADSLMTRVGAYYHDSGKLLNPGFFIENQRAGENVHDGLDPAISASIIISHVKDGVQLEDQYRLPTRYKILCGSTTARARPYSSIVRPWRTEMMSKPQTLLTRGLLLQARRPP